jgi:hypothetical protein
MRPVDAPERRLRVVVEGQLHPPGCGLVGPPPKGSRSKPRARRRSAGAGGNVGLDSSSSVSATRCTGDFRTCRNCATQHNSWTPKSSKP